MKRVLASLILLAAISARAAASDWPQFRGQDSTGISADATIPAQPKVDWSAPLPGRGLAGPIVVGGRVFVACSSGPQQDRLHVLCFNESNGAKLWERQLLATGRTMSHPKTCVAACTPCSDGKRLYVLWSSNDLAAFDLDGNLQWLRGLTVDYPNASNSLGMASSPVVIGETVVTMIENESESYALGVDAKIGRNLWKLERPKIANWTSPLVWRADEDASAVAVLQSVKGLVAVDPASGSRLWEYTGGASTVSSSVVAGRVIFAASGGITALAPKAGTPAPEQLWRAKGMNPSTISPMVLGNLHYSINGAGVITAADTGTAESRWKLRLTGPFSGSPVGSGTRLLVVNENGLVQVVDVSGAEGAIAGTLQLPLKKEAKELILCTPALSGDHVYLRTDSTLWRLGPS
jgi:outer membrane protein assembly factor BamB